MNRDMAEIEGACHCGAVRLRVRLTNGLHTAHRCNCSYCRMRGAVAVSAPLDGLTLLSGSAVLGLYQFNTMTAEHYFCSRCGIHTHHRRRSNPNEYSINVACLEGLSPFDFEEVIVSNGVLHRSDDKTGTGRRIAGVLRYTSGGGEPE